MWYQSYFFIYSTPNDNTGVKMCFQFVVFKINLQENSLHADSFLGCLTFLRISINKM